MGGKSRPHRDSILDRPTRSSVAIPTELHTQKHKNVYCTEILVIAVSDKAAESDNCLLYVDKLRHMKECTFQTSYHKECST